MGFNLRELAMSQPKEPKKESRPSSVGGSKLGIEIKVKKDAPKSKLGPNGQKGGDIANSKADGGQKSGDSPAGTKNNGKDGTSSIQSSQIQSNYSPAHLGASEYIADPHMKSTSNFAPFHLDRAKSDKLGNEVYKAVLQVCSKDRL